MNGIYTILLLIASNIFMTLAWYGHLKLQQTGVTASWPLLAVVAFSWGIAFFEYCCQVPANRMGFVGNGGHHQHDVYRARTSLESLACVLADYWSCLSGVLEVSLAPVASFRCSVFISS